MSQPDEPCLLLCTCNMCLPDEASQNLFTLQSNSSHQDDTLYSILFLTEGKR
uniref:Uncharacterized protein n=1 Tax=Arundo donax TaxID=35708 RepID=A0A0A9F055_ARUDO